MVLFDGKGVAAGAGRGTEVEKMTRSDSGNTDSRPASGNGNPRPDSGNGARGPKPGSGNGRSGARPPHRAAFRRKLPFGRGAVLQVGERGHIVGVADISVTGAFLSTQAPVSVGEIHTFRLLVLPERVEISIKAEIVRLAQTANESSHHPRGVGVRFVELDDHVREYLAFYVARKPNPRPY